MASSSCQKCLLRTTLPYAISRPTSRTLRNPSCSNPFSTSAAMAAMPPVRKAVSATARSAQSFQKSAKRKIPVKTGKPPAPGERKAARKRIILSNTNALEVPGIEEMTPEALTDVGNIGKVLSLPGDVVDYLRAMEAFKVTQSWAMFRKPGMLVREEGVKLAKVLEHGVRPNSHVNLIIDGNRASGKSIMILQAMVAALMKGWIVLHIPEVQELTTATTDYAPIRDTTPTQYSQNVYTATWLNQILKGNLILGSLEVQQTHVLPITLPSGTTLARLAELGARDPEIAWPFFKALWTEMTLPGRPPILMTLDGLNHACKDSLYRDPQFKPIHSLDFVILGHFFDYLSNKRTLPNGGAVIAATTKGNAPNNPAVDLAIKQAVEMQTLGSVLTQPDPFKPVVERDYRILQAAGVLQLGGLSKDEARGLMEYWAASGVFRARVDEKTVCEKWALGGNGIVGEMERAALRMRV